MRQNTGPSPVDSKSRFRRELRSRRNSLSTQLRVAHDKAIRQHLVHLVNSLNVRSIACYWPFNGEPDITPACRQLITDGYKLALPVISGNNNHAMKFHTWRTDTELVKNSYGILEPKGSASLPPSSFDMLIMPLVGYDRQGNRLGMGSGYYDRHLEPLRDMATPLRVGIAYSLQEIDRIEKNKWDVPLHGVVNECGWFTFAG